MKKTRMKKIICLLLAAAALLVCAPGTVLADPGENTDVKGKIVTGSRVNVRTGPGTGYPVLKSSSGSYIRLTDGHELEVGESVQSEDPDNPGYWYDVGFTFEGEKYRGYVYSVYVTVTPDEIEVVIHEDFEKVIEKLPESYKDPLRKLKTLHPTWQFKILFTGLDWNEVLENESVYGRSLVSTTIPAQRSTDPSCYDWLTDTYTPIEGAKWFQASRETIGYYMDPRNFLTEDSVFQFETLSYDKSTQTIEGVEKIISKNTFMKDAKISDGSTKLTYAETFMRAAALSNVSPYHLAARCIQEIGNKLGKATSGKTEGYEGYYNFYNIGANTGVMAGLKYAKTGGSLSAESKKMYLIPWNSQYKAIVGGAILIGNNYINKGQNTLYLERYDVEPTNGLYWHQYMVNVSAAYFEGRNIYSTYKALGLIESPLTFIIPVFENMPETPWELPVAEGSVNNRLKSLTVGSLPLTPTFSHDVNSYYIVTGSDAPSSVNISAVPVSETAKVSGDVGEKTLQPGLNTFTVTVTAENGSVHYYYIYVAPSADLIPPEPPAPPTTAPPSTPAPASSSADPTGTAPSSTAPATTAQTGSYSVSFPHSSWLITGLALGTTLDQLRAGLGLTGTATAQFTRPDGSEATSGTVTSDILVTLRVDGKRQLYRTLIYGDVDCDGQITAIDLLMVRRMLLGTWSPSAEAPKVAADPDRDGKISAVDLLMIRRQILGTYTIKQ